MIVEKNDETKGFTVHLPKDMVVVTMQRVEDAEMLDNRQNVWLHVQIKTKDPKLWHSIEEREEAAKQ